MEYSEKNLSILIRNSGSLKETEKTNMMESLHTNSEEVNKMFFSVLYVEKETLDKLKENPDFFEGKNFEEEMDKREQEVYVIL